MSKTKTNNAWFHMLDRCYNKNNNRYLLYGGRGIYVCDRWKSSFENFLQDMGVGPKGMSIERKNNDGPYSKDNCCWIPMSDQSKNRGNNILYSYNGEEKTLPEWSRTLMLPHKSLWARIRKCNWSVKRAFETPIMSMMQAGQLNYGKSKKNDSHNEYKIRGYAAE